MAFTGPPEDRLLIRERMGAYADAAFRGDREAWLANWAEDCVWFTLGTEFRGKPALAEQWPKLWQMMDAMSFFTEVGAIEVQAERAIARCYTLEILDLKGGGVRQVVGRYDDELVRQGGVWLFARRSYSVLMNEARAGEAR